MIRRAVSNYSREMILGCVEGVIGGWCFASREKDAGEGSS